MRLGQWRSEGSRRGGRTFSCAKPESKSESTRRRDVEEEGTDYAPGSPELLVGSVAQPSECCGKRSEA